MLFPFVKQLDAMDCEPACLTMITQENYLLYFFNANNLDKSDTCCYFATEIYDLFDWCKNRTKGNHGRT